MKKRKFIRLQLFALFAVIALLFYRVVEGPAEPNGFVVWTEIGEDRLRHEAFTLESQTRFFIDATGSFEGDIEVLAAYAWILNRENRQVVWKMDGEAEARQ